MKIQSIIFHFAFVLVIGCFTAKAQSQSNDNKTISALIEKKRDYNKRKGFGYCIQLYNGNEDKAKKIKENFEKLFPEVENRLKYKAPEWKVQVGNYKTTLEAEKALLEINLKFSGAIVIPIKN